MLLPLAQVHLMSYLIRWVVSDTAKQSPHLARLMFRRPLILPTQVVNVQGL